MRNKLTYLITGLLLIFANFSMRVTSIDPVSLSLIEEVEKYDSSKLWDGFEMSSYTKDIWYNFNKEYRYESGKITAKKPDHPVVSIEALKENGKPLIKAIPFDKFRAVYGSQDASSVDYVKASYKSVFIHESFHCYQMQHGLSLVSDITEAEGEVDEDYDEFMAAIEALDNDKTFKDLWEAEYMGLLDLYETGNPDAYKTAKAKKDAYIKEKFPKLAKDLDFYNTYKEFIEGTAQLVQEKYIADVMGLLDDIKYEDRVFSKLEQTYYTEGSLKARILDKYYKAWRDDLSFAEDNNLDKMMERGNIL